MGATVQSWKVKNIIPLPPSFTVDKCVRNRSLPLLPPLLLLPVCPAGWLSAFQWLLALWHFLPLLVLRASFHFPC